MPIRRIPILVRLHLLTVPLIVMGLVVALITRSSLRKNPRELLQARDVEELAVRSLALLLTRDDASKTLILNPNDAAAQTRKTDAYNENQRVLSQITQLTESHRILTLTKELGELDERQLRPLDQKVLALRNTGDIGQTIETYYSQYEPARKTYEGILRELVDEAEKAAAQAAKNVEAHNLSSLRLICGALGVGTLLAVLIVSF